MKLALSQFSVTKYAHQLEKYHKQIKIERIKILTKFFLHTYACTQAVRLKAYAYFIFVTMSYSKLDLEI